MHEVRKRKIYLLQRTYEGFDLNRPDKYFVKKTFNNEQVFISYLYHSYNAETKGYWFDWDLDRTGKETRAQSYWKMETKGDGLRKTTYQFRKRWMFAEEIDADWLEVLNPVDFQRRVDDIVRRKGAKKQGPLFRREPIPNTSKRSMWYNEPDTRVKHTGWYREEIARQKMDQEDYPKRHAKVQPKREDWNFYHKHSPREFKSWKNKKIRHQWMKNLR